MPRDGSNIYSIPPGTQGVPNTTIESAKYNAYIADIEVDLNAPRPIIAGGTGGNSAASARANLQAERSMQVITNFDSAVWEVGSFYAAAGATGAPVAGHAFAGIVYGPDANNMVIEARDLGDTATPGLLYIREKTAGVWAAWSIDGSSKVDRAGDTMTGNLIIRKSAPVIALDRTDAASTAIQGLRAGLIRWQVVPGDNVAEAGANAGSNFLITRSADTGANIDTPFSINRASGIVTATGLPSYAEAQALTAAQQEQLRQNVYAAPFDALAYNGMQINGTGEINQEEITSIALTNGVIRYIADGWRAQMNSATALGITASATNAAGAAPVGVRRALELRATPGIGTVGAADLAFFDIPLEGYRASRAGFGLGGTRYVSLGFYAYASIPGDLGVTLANAAASRVISKLVHINAGTTWEWKTVTFPVDTTATGWDYTNACGLRIVLFAAAGSAYQGPVGVWSGSAAFAPVGLSNFMVATNAVVQVSHFIIVPGTELPSAERAAYILRSADRDIAPCQRFYWKWTPGTFNNTAANGLVTTTTAAGFQFPHPVTMRAFPSIGLSGLSLWQGAGTVPVTSLGFTYPGTQTSLFSVNSSAHGFAVGSALGLMGQSGSSFLSGDARL